MLRFAVTLFAVITSSACQQYGCLEGDTQKLKPSPEPNMHECALYSKSSCCYADFTEQLTHSPVIKVSNSYWNRCLFVAFLIHHSCEDFTKKIECFYRYEACKDDSICVRNWLKDWEWDESGENHCKNKCIPYSEMYANGTDMCQNMWGESFKVSVSSCLCLQMNKKDTIAIKYLLSESSEESSSSSSSSNSEEHACQNKLLKFEKLKGKEGEQTR
ncbi:RBP protein, partial [Calyptomena viridis]|nr:RBP protein [Calyptomena viridis]